MAEFPFDLEHLYGSMMQQIRESEDSVLCENILRLVAVVYRPVTLAELASLLELEEGISGEDLKEVIWIFPGCERRRGAVYPYIGPGLLAQRQGFHF